MAVLARLQVQDVDAAMATATSIVFVRCRQKALSTSGSSVSSTSGVRLPALQLDVVEGDAIWRGEVTEEHKPMVLDCSASKYLATLESVFSARATTSANKRAFVYKWSRKSGVLTLMEESAPDFAMKYTSIALTRVCDDDGDEKQGVWQSLLNDIVDVSVHTMQEMTRQRTRIDALERLLTEKDAVLETALRAKEQLEEQLFEGFCAVLNAKKDEIQRLQHELVIAQMQADAGPSNGKPSAAASTKTKKAVNRLRVTKAKGAKLKRKHIVEDDDDDEDQGSSSEEDEAESYDGASQGDDDDDTGTDSSSRRAKRDAINAYSQLPSHSSQMCSADDMLDELMKQEVAADDAIVEDAISENNSSSRSKRPRLPARRGQEKKKKRTSEASSREEEEKKTKSVALVPVPQAPPPPRAAPANVVDSEEEDLLDMLC